MTGRSFLARLALAALWVWLVACARSPEPPPAGFAGLSFGAPEPPGLTPVPTVLPREWADSLAFFNRPGRNESFRGVPLAEPVYAFYQGRFFSVSAALADPADLPRLRQVLEAAYGAPVCGSGKDAACLWRLADVDVVVEGRPKSAARFMLRYRPIADRMAAKRGQEAPLEREGRGASR